MPLTDNEHVETIEEGGGRVTEGDIVLLFEDCEQLYKELQRTSGKIAFDFYKLRSRMEFLMEEFWAHAGLPEGSSKVQEVGGGEDSLRKHTRLAKSKQGGLFDRPSRPQEAGPKAQAPKAKKEKSK